jgi:hypothetical protein
MFITAVTNARQLSLSWARSVQSMPPIPFAKDPFYIILQSASGSSKWSLSLRFPHKNHVCTFHLPHTFYIPCPSHSCLFDHPHYIWWGAHIIKLLLMCLLQFPVTSFLLVTNNFLGTLLQPMFLSQCERPSVTPVQTLLLLLLYSIMWRSRLRIKESSRCHSELSVFMFYWLSNTRNSKRV